MKNSKPQPPSSPTRPSPLLWCLLLLAMAPLAAHAQANSNPPGQMSYQGFLTDANGIPLATNYPLNYTVQFRIYNASTGGSNLWGEVQVVTVDRGYFTVMLGNGSSFGPPFTNNLASIFSGSDASDRYLEMTVNELGGTPITPRLRLLPSPYSFLASKALSLDGSAVSSGTIPDARLSSNVALRSGGNAFSGNQTITGNLFLTSGTFYTDNGQYFYAKNSSGNYEGYLVPRWSDNGTYLNFGDGGFFLRDNKNNYYMSVSTNGNTSFGGPINFPNTLGDKISLWGGVGNNNFGFGIQGALLQIHTDVSASDIAFGYGQSTNLTETMRIKGNGNVGIGTNSPQAALHVNGGASYSAALIDGRSTAGTWLSLRNTSSGGTNWSLISTASGNGEGAGKLLFETAAGPMMTLLPGGSVGIGTTTPGAPLGVTGTAAGVAAGGSIDPSVFVRVYNAASSGTGPIPNVAGIAFGHNSTRQAIVGGTFGYDFLDFYTGGSLTNPRVRIDANGLVGIGTTTPGVPLDVNGSAGLGFGAYGYLNNITPTGKGGGATATFSIRASDRIMAIEFDAVSDKRIKDIIGQSDRQADLEVIQKLRVTDYRMKDRVANGDIPCKGFIAQEVETVIPEAVTQSKQFVPDIYAAASAAKFDPAAKTVAVKLAKAHELKTGDRVRLITEAGHMDLAVSSVPSEQEFVAANCEKDPKQIFVFGKEVNDFRTLNYDRIFTTGISAMQELARRVSALEAHETNRLALEKRAGRVDELEREVADLKAVVAKLAESQKHQASAGGAGFGVPPLSGSDEEVTQSHSTAQPGE